MIILHNLHIIDVNATTIVIDKGVIHTITNEKDVKASLNALNIHFDNCLAFPGLINSHDHLDFDLFPKLGNKIYEDYIDWGNDIHAVNKEEITSILKIPRELRIQWGVYKNLLAGVTTVVHHGEYVKTTNDLIDVFQDCNMLHSVQLEKYWKLKLNKPCTKGWPYVIHIGEGTNQQAHNEIDALIKWNLCKRKLIGVHGVALDEKQAASFEALIWCPDSNYFLLNKTASVDQLKHATNILFGTDSTVSASWNIWDHLRLARETNMLSDKELFDSLTSTAASIWNFKNKGSLSENIIADIVITKMKKDDPINSFYTLNPEDILLIIKNGSIILFDESLQQQLSENIPLNSFSKVFVGGISKYVRGNLPLLINQVKAYGPEVNFSVQVE